jgi:hypothetical protein
MASLVDTFFYGLFMDADLLRASHCDPQSPRQASVEGLSLRVGARATLVPDPGGRAYGILMRLTHGELERLYAQPSVAIYRPIAVLAEPADAPPVPALCYVIPDPPAHPQGDAEYAAKLADLAHRLGLPKDYVGHIRSGQ